VNASEPEFQFREEDHTYWLRYPGGRSVRLPGCTEIIDAHGFIPDYAKQEFAALRGSYVHEAAHYLFERRLDWATVDESLKGYLASLELWMRITGFVPEACEVMLYHPMLLFAGTYDVKGTMPNGSKWLIDLKSSNPAWWHGVQLAAYLLLEGGYRRRAGLYLQQDGRLARMREYRDETDTVNFISMLNVYRLQEKK